MAQSSRYDEFEDVGMAFTDEEIAAYDMQAVALERVGVLTELVLRPAKRKLQLKPQYPTFVGQMIKITTGVVTWYGTALELPRTREDLEAAFARMDPETDEGKAITIQAQQMNYEDLLLSWEAQVIGVMRKHVTIGRRCSTATKVSGWKKADKSMSNKLANCIVREMDAVEKLTKSLEARK